MESRGSLDSVEERPLPAIFLFPEPLRLIRILRPESDPDAVDIGLKADVLVEEIDAGSGVSARSFSAAEHCIFRISFVDVEPEEAAVLFDHFFLKGIQFFPSNILWHFTHMP